VVKALLDKGAAGLDFGVEGQIQGRLRSPGTDDVVVTATAEANSIEFAKPVGPSTIESDPTERIRYRCCGSARRARSIPRTRCRHRVSGPARRGRTPPTREAPLGPSQ